MEQLACRAFKHWQLGLIALHLQESPLIQELTLRKKKEGEMYLAHFKIIKNGSNAVLQILNFHLHSYFQQI